LEGLWEYSALCHLIAEYRSDPCLEAGGPTCRWRYSVVMQCSDSACRPVLPAITDSDGGSGGDGMEVHYCECLPDVMALRLLWGVTVVLIPVFFLVTLMMPCDDIWSSVVMPEHLMTCYSVLPT